MSQPIQTPPAPTADTDPKPAVTPAVIPPQGDPAAAPKAPEPQGDPNALGDPGKRALQVERDARQKAVADLAALRKEIADANKTAEEKAAETLREAQELAAKAAAKALKYEVAAELGVPLAMAARLVGTTREEIATDAAALLAQIPAAAPHGPVVPATGIDQGGREQSTPDIDQQIAEAEKAGQYSLSISLKRQKAAAAAAKK